MKLADVCVARPVFAVMLIAFLVTLGIFSYRTLGVDLFPRADPATVYVGVELPGASPEEMTTSVVLPLEDAISSVNGLDEMTVYTTEGISRLICTFVLERDIEGAAQDIREKVSGALNRLPPNILPPVIRKLDPDSDPILTVLVAGPMSRRELTEIADKQVRRAIQTVNGVGEVDITGGQARQIRIFIDAERLTAHGLTVADVRDAVQRENVEAPGGHLIRGPQDLGLRTLGRVDSAGQFANIIVAMRGGAPIRVREVGQVEDGAEELRTWAMLLRKDHVPRDAVSVSVLRQSGTNTVRVADSVKRRLETLKLELPPGVHLEVVQDISVFIKASVHSLLEHLVLGSFLASLVVLLFIRNWRAVLIAALAIPTSIIATFTLMPMMSSGIVVVGASGGHARSREAKFLHVIESFYLRSLEWALAHRVMVLMICLVTFASSFFFYRRVGRDFIPADDQSELQSSLDLPEGSSLERTMATVTEMAHRIEALPEVEFVQPYTHGTTNHAHLYIRLVDRSQRKRTHEQMAQEVRRILGSFRNITYNVRLPSTLGGELWFPIRAIIRGPDIPQLVEISKQVAARMREFPGLVDINPNLNLNSPELQVKVDRQRAADLGVRMADVGSTVRLMYSGRDEISTFKEGSEQYSVTMQLLTEQRDNPDVLGRLMVPSSKVGQVRLENLATIQRGSGPATLWRYNREFQVSVNANVAAGYPLDAAAAYTVRSIKAVGLPPGYSYLFSGQVKLLEETTFNMLLAMLLASIFMYMVLAAQFESFSHPFIIMLTLPLSIPFALFSLWITGRALSLWSALGVFLLLGIVKKNGILQVDYTNRLRAEGQPLREALLEANRVRLRPILMTTFSIVAGLIPVALGIGAGSGQRAAIAVTIIGGQTLCLLLTLLVVPVAYSYLAEWEEVRWTDWLGANWGRLRAGLARRLGLSQ